jgi:hypothetical protein
MGWEGFMQTERSQIRQRREGKLRRALGVALPGETVDQLDLLGEWDRVRAEQGLVPIMGEGGTISYKPLADLLRQELPLRTAAEGVQVGWLKERVERRRKGQDSPSIPHHLG